MGNLFDQVTVGEAVAAFTTASVLLGLWWKSANAYSELRKELDSKLPRKDFEAHEKVHKDFEHRLFQVDQVLEGKQDKLACAKCRREVDEALSAHREAFAAELHKKAAKVDLVEIVATQRELSEVMARLQADLGNILALVQETRQDVRELMRGGRA